ncbi:MAG: rRNA maturation RNase YbeY [Pseudomonadales bacterium]|nr:rRNA maturation RNase YbeY [Pseudomonadales bacterium]
MRVEVQHAEEFTEPVLDQTDCEDWLAALVRELAVTANRSVCIRVCSAEESRSLNATYRGIDKPTNVLSFPVEINDEIAVDAPILGDIAICWPVVEREAREQNKPLEQHATHLVLHGVLHLMGYDHVEEGQAEEMEAVEVAVLASLGVPDPYL